MAFRDDILIRLGVDPRNFNRELRTATNRAKSFARNIGFAFAAGGLVSFTRSLMQFSGRIDTMAKTIGVSTDFLQGFQSAMEKNGVAAEKSEMGLQRFSRRLGEAVNGTGELKADLDKLGIEYVDATGKARRLEDVMYDYADAIAATESEQEQLRLMFKAADSEAASMVGTFKKGSEELRKLIEEGTKASEQNLTRLAEAENKFAAFKRWMFVNAIEKGFFVYDEVLSKNLISDLKMIAGAAGEAQGGVISFGDALTIAMGGGGQKNGGVETLREQIHRLTLEEMEREKAAKAAADARKIKEDEFNEAMKEEDIALQKIYDKEEARLDTLNAQLAVKKQMAEQDRASSFRDMSAFSLEELANVEGWLSGKAFQQRAMAQQSLFLQSEAKRARLWGEDGIAEDLTQRSLDIRKNIGALSDSEQNPLGKIDKTLVDANAGIQELLERAKGMGLNINPVNGQ